MKLIHSLLMKAIEGESGAEARYKVFSTKAQQEGFIRVAALFSTLSRAEAVHIANHKRALLKNGYQSVYPEISEDIEAGTTLENIDEAIHAEYEEFHTMYPSFRRQISKKHGAEFKAKIALLSIKWACECEGGHHTLLKMARKRVASGNDLKEGTFYLCSVCGNLHYLAKPPETLCHICGHDLSFYTEIRV